MTRDFADVLRSDICKAIHARVRSVLQEACSRLEGDADPQGVYAELQACLEAAMRLGSALGALPQASSPNGVAGGPAATPLPASDLRAVVDRLLVEAGGEARVSEILEAAYRELRDRLPPDLLAVPPRSRIPRWQNRIYHYLSALHRRGLASRPKVGCYRLTDRGRQALQAAAPLPTAGASVPPLPDRVLRQAFLEVLTQRRVARQSTRALARILSAYLAHRQGVDPRQLTGESWDQAFARVLTWALEEGAIQPTHGEAGRVPEVIEPLPRARELLVSWISTDKEEDGYGR